MEHDANVKLVLLVKVNVGDRLWLRGCAARHRGKVAVQIEASGIAALVHFVAATANGEDE
jgi:hypothetical protein